MSKWLGKFLQKEPRSRTDNTDRTGNKDHLSVLSVPPGSIFYENAKNMPGNCTDKTDRTDNEGLLSVLSVPPGGIFYEKTKNISENQTDKADKSNGVQHLSDLSGSISDPFVENSILDAFEERIAIAQYDGQQDTMQARRIAYQDAFISVLNALPSEDMDDGDWFERRTKVAKEWLASKGIEQSEYKVTEH